MTWVYIRTEERLWTVGFYAPGGTWNTDSDHSTKEEAADRCAYLNGSARDRDPEHDCEPGLAHFHGKLHSQNQDLRQALARDIP